VPGPNGDIRHPAPPPGQPQETSASLEVLHAAFESTKATNQAKLADLQRQGVEVDPLSFVHARIDKLIDSIASFAGPQGPRWSLLARLSFEQHIAAELSAAEAEAGKAQLALGSQFTPAMIAQLARETGMFRRA
jgi:hypothetical protein